MGISGTDRYVTPAIAATARAGATRSYALALKVCIQVDGVERGWGRASESYEVEDLVITDLLNEAPNRATFTARGWVPTVGMDVSIRLGTRNNLDLLFAGVVLTVEASHTGLLATYAVSCVDHTWGLNRRLVSGYYTGTASTIAQALIASYASGYSSTFVQAGMPTVDGGITFTNESLPAALTRLMKRVGGTWYCDSDKVIHAYTDADPRVLNEPRTLADGLASLLGAAVTRDLSQVVTRVYVEGGGGTALAAVAPGDTTIPVSVADWYEADGGLVTSGPQRIAYTGLVEGGGGTLIGPGIGPASAPALELDGSASGVENGEHDYAVTFVTGAGESLPGPLATITVEPLAAPSTAPAGSVSTGGSVTVGDHRYAYTHVNAAGETTPSPVSDVVTAVETSIPDPDVYPVGTLYSGGGLSAGVYLWAYTWTDGLGGETLPSPTKSYTATAGQGCNIVPGGGFGLYTTYNLYRTVAGGSQLKFVKSGDNGNVLDDVADAALGANAPTSNTTAIDLKTVNVIGIAAGPAGTSSRKLYRTEAGGSTYKLLATIADNTTTTYADTTADGSLGAAAPSSNTAARRHVAVTSIPTGSASVTARKVYRTAAGASQLKLLGTIANNTTSYYADTTADSSLGANVPTSDTSGLAQPDGQVLAGATSIPVAGAASFSASGGWLNVGNKQIARYTGISGNTLTGVPASGVGAIAATFVYGTTVTALPHLSGIPASGDGAVQYAITEGDEVNLVVRCDDTDAQATMSALLGGDGIIEDTMQDRRLSASESTARGQAWLELHSGIEVTLSYQSSDAQTRSGRSITASLTSPVSVAGTFRIQQVTTSAFTPLLPPTHDVVASSTRFSFEDLLRMLR